MLSIDSQNRRLLAAAAIIGLFTRADFAHIKNEATQFPDIEFSPARFDIVVLVGAGIIPETPVFEPDVPLSRFDLATWAALANDLGEGGETPDTKALAALALEHGLVESLAGSASYQDINNVFLRGELNVAEPAATPTKGEAASFVAAQLTSVAGRALLDTRAVRSGPTGVVERAQMQTNDDGGNSYVITVGATSAPMFAHGRVANGPVDLAQWQGRVVRRSFLRELGEYTVWTYLEAEPKERVVQEEAAAAAEEAATDTAANRNVLYGLIGAVVILGLVLFVKRARRV